jgi:TctA family transporter
MKNFTLKHPAIFSFIIFLIIFIGGSIAGIIFGILMMEECKPKSLSDPCDGGAMAAVFIWTLSFMASLILGFVAGISTFLFLKFKSKLS